MAMYEFKAFKSANVRIYNIEKVPVGAGLLVSREYVLTCAHVVKSALKISSETSTISPQPIDVDFPRIENEENLKVQVNIDFWELEKDIAVLKIASHSKLPRQAQPAILASIEDTFDHSFRAFGFPQGHPDGVWATGILKGTQMQNDTTGGYNIQPGFSGAPVWDKNLASIAGIVVAQDTMHRGAKTGFLIPTSQLIAVLQTKNLTFHQVTSPSLVNPRYRPIINAFTDDDSEIVPFLGAGINFCDRSQGMLIELAKKLTDQYYPPEDNDNNLIGIPSVYSPFFDPSLKSSPTCILWQEQLDISNREYKYYSIDFPLLINESRLPLTKINLRFLSQYISLLEKNLYHTLHDCLDNTYNKLLKDETNPHRVQDFFARLPKKILEKGFRSFPYKLIVTTNYDETLENIFDKVGQEYDVVFYIAEGNDRGRFKHKNHRGEINATPIDPNYKLPLGKRPIILKLFGTWQHEFVISENHYINYLYGCSIDQVLPAELINIIIESKILFVGYSLSDPDLQLILYRFWENNSLKNTREMGGSDSWIIHQSKPGKLEQRILNARQIESIESSVEDFITNLEMGIEQK